jgi:hypothetical protein
MNLRTSWHYQTRLCHQISGVPVLPYRSFADDAVSPHSYDISVTRTVSIRIERLCAPRQFNFPSVGDLARDPWPHSSICCVSNSRSRITMSQKDHFITATSHITLRNLRCLKRPSLGINTELRDISVTFASHGRCPLGKPTCKGGHAPFSKVVGDRHASVTDPKPTWRYRVSAKN